jgi:hypothetical protein
MTTNNSKNQAPDKQSGQKPDTQKSLPVKQPLDNSPSYHIKYYGIKSYLALIIVLTLCVLDSKLTILIINAGGYELNPLLRLVINWGIMPFVLTKYSITGICLIFLIIHKNFYLFGGRINVKTIVTVILILYVFLILYESYLLMKITWPQ